MSVNEALKRKLLEIATDDGVWNIGIKNLKIARRHQVTGLRSCFYNSMILYMVQGAKKTVLDNLEFSYHAKQCIVSSIDMPSLSMITEASSDRPMLCIALELDSALMAEMLRETKVPVKSGRIKTGLGVINADEAMVEAFYRLISLKDQPEESRETLASFIIREIYYRLLISPAGSELRLANTSGTQSNQISRAIAWLKTHFSEHLDVKTLAAEVNMSPTSFYRNFNKLTRITPVQYQKQLRLYEAQRLLLSEKTSAENAAYQVGYKSASQFNRDYKRMFGLPPAADIRQMKS